MSYVQANLGRNIGPIPMPLEAWEAFRREVRAVLAMTTGAPNVDEHLGTGKWTDETGGIVWEESAHLSVYTDSTMSLFNTRTLRDSLAGLARRYNQDAVALIIAQSELIGGK